MSVESLVGADARQRAVVGLPWKAILGGFLGALCAGLIVAVGLWLHGVIVWTHAVDQRATHGEQVYQFLLQQQQAAAQQAPSAQKH